MRPALAPISGPLRFFVMQKGFFRCPLRAGRLCVCVTVSLLYRYWKSTVTGVSIQLAIHKRCPIVMRVYSPSPDSWMGIDGWLGIIMCSITNGVLFCPLWVACRSAYCIFYCAYTKTRCWKWHAVLRSLYFLCVCLLFFPYMSSFNHYAIRNLILFKTNGRNVYSMYTQ